MYTRLGREVLHAADLISADASPPPLPALPALASGEVWSGWTWSADVQRWEGVICDAERKTRGPYELGFPRRPRSGAKYVRVSAEPVHQSGVRSASA